MSRAFKKTGELKKCSCCGKESYKTKAEIIRSKTSNFFCNRSCANSFNNRFKNGRNHPNYIDGGTQYRKKALKHYGVKCMNPKCELTKAGVVIMKEMLDVDHVDSNRKNNSLKNLQVLCVWCHALKTRKINAKVA